ncbi:hypothetical protein JOB18_023867 [Solea senegalensis]|uniref:Uncharacterized protein n=1 Tax=Solea senegalensis TaxID=28829 RepID=A0AAV6S4A6_SOLSE|nr:hypothetical protein JOB18_023867 [Solea senegalensis]
MVLWHHLAVEGSYGCKPPEGAVQQSLNRQLNGSPLVSGTGNQDKPSLFCCVTARFGLRVDSGSYCSV